MRRIESGSGRIEATRLMDHPCIFIILEIRKKPKPVRNFSGKTACRPQEDVDIKRRIMYHHSERFRRLKVIRYSGVTKQSRALTESGALEPLYQTKLE